MMPLGLVLIAVACLFAPTITPVMIMLGVMGASDDPNNIRWMRIPGYSVCVAGLAIPIVLFVTCTVLIIKGI